MQEQIKQIFQEHYMQEQIKQIFQDFSLKGK